MKRLLLSLLLCFAGCAPTEAPPPAAAAATPANATGPMPALWRVSDEDTTIWLFGTIHILPRDFEWRSDRLDQAIAASDELVLETVTGDSSDTAGLLMQLGIAPNLPPIADRVAPGQQQTLAAMIARSAYPADFLNGLETWASALMLVGVTINDLGLQSGSGAEEALETAFRQAGKPLEGLETPAQQLGYFDALPEDVQRYFLSTVIDTPADVRAEFDAMLDAWTHGDEEAIARTFDDELLASEPLREALLTQRNRNWAQWIDNRLDQPGTILVAVGAGHLAGDRSVQAFLHQRGIDAVRVQ